MKVALCLSGHLRAWKQCYPSIKQLIDKYQPDIFISTWDCSGYWHANNKTIDNNYNPISVEELNELLNTYQPKMINIEYLTPDKQEAFKKEALDIFERSGEYRHRFGNFGNIIGMFYKLADCIKLKNQYEQDQNIKYDLIIRSRPDVFLNINCDLKTTHNIINIHSYLGYNEGIPISLINDRFFAGDSQVMDKIGSIYGNLEKIYNETKCLFDPHDLLSSAISLFKIEKNDIILQDYVWNTIGGYCK